MSEFSELIKNFDKVRDYMRDFFIYGFKTRTDFQYKSLRTYDNEKRRIQSWLGDLIHFDTSKKGKQVSLCVDSSRLLSNPLYKAYQSKSFTDNDIRLHFYLLDVLKDSEPLSIDDITDKLCDNYDGYSEPQTIRLKLKEYVLEGIILQHKFGKTFRYSLSTDTLETFTNDSSCFNNMIKFFSEAAPFGIIGNYLSQQLDLKNETFLFKHNYIVHTLDDGIVLSLLKAIEEKRLVKFINFGKHKQETTLCGIALKVFVSTQTGRRYIVMYQPNIRRFNAFRIDSIKSVKLLDIYEDYDYYATKLESNTPYCWGITFGNIREGSAKEQFKMVLHINEQTEPFVLERLKREGRNGIVERISDNIFAYSTEVFDTNEMMGWVKTFIGRIISIEGTNQPIIDKFYRDIGRMKQIYRKEG